MIFFRKLSDLFHATEVIFSSSLPSVRQVKKDGKKMGAVVALRIEAVMSADLGDLVFLNLDEKGNIWGGN